MTLAITPETTAQEIFDYVVNHLLTQNKQAKNSPDSCAYRTDDGLKCAVGCLIPLSAYQPEMEMRGVGSLIVDFAHVPAIAALRAHAPLLQKLQLIHDTHSPCHWRENLSDLAQSLNLTFTPPEEPAQ